MADVIMDVRNLKKNFGPNQILKGINFKAYRGEVVCIIGASGSGKSTLLRCMNLLEIPTSGEIYFEGVNILDRSVDPMRLTTKMAAFLLSN